ncbi:MAG: ABC transporter permease [Ignavibacteriaceae bacterium]
MNKTFVIAKWEYFEKIKTKTFIISLFLTPAIIIGFALAPTLISDRRDDSTKAIGVIDTSGIFFKPLLRNVEQFKLANGQPNYLLINLAGNKKNLIELKKSGDENTVSGKLEGYLLIRNYPNDSCKIEYRTKNAGNFKELSNLKEAFNNTRIELKLSKEGINSTLMKFISNRVDIEVVKIEKEGKKSSSDFIELFFTSIIFIILLMMMVISSGGMLVRSLVEEKSNRLIEIIISSCSPNELLAGKVLGLSALGLTQVLIWTLVCATLAGSAIVPPDVFNNILPILLFFILGFIFYSAIFVGIGSIVSSEQEAQQITSYLSLTMMLPLAFALPAIENPNSSFVHILSFIPLTIPATMILRFSIGPIPLWELVISIIIMAISIYLSIFVAGKVFRVGILSYGKRPSLKEIMNWLKEE